jgi:protein-disulfide isomerase/uncharacterized membrane protein
MRKLFILSLLALMGFISSAYQSYHFYEARNGETTFKSFCNINTTFNCDVVSASGFAELGWGLPLSSAAAGWFLALFLIAWIARNPFWKREALRCAWGLALGATFFSIVYLSVMAFVLKTYCLVCLLIDVLSIISLILVQSLKPENFKKHKLDQNKWKVFLGILLTCLAFSVIGLKMFDPASRGDRSNTRSAREEIVQSILQTPPVALSRDDSMPYFGTQDAPVTLVEFSDFQCPHCKKGAFIMHTLLNRYPGKLKVIPRHFPLDASCNRSLKQQGHVAACEAAKASLCAHYQGKFDRLYESLFENQALLAPGVALKLSKELGLDDKKMALCIESMEVASAISKDIEEALQLNIQSTPTFFINGKKVEGAYSFEVWSEVIEKLLKP